MYQIQGTVPFRDGAFLLRVEESYVIKICGLYRMRLILSLFVYIMTSHGPKRK